VQKSHNKELTVNLLLRQSLAFCHTKTNGRWKLQFIGRYYESFNSYLISKKRLAVCDTEPLRLDIQSVYVYRFKVTLKL